MGWIPAVGKAIGGAVSGGGGAATGGAASGAVGGAVGGGASGGVAGSAAGSAVGGVAGSATGGIGAGASGMAMGAATGAAMKGAGLASVAQAGTAGAGGGGAMGGVAKAGSAGAKSASAGKYNVLNSVRKAAGNVGDTVKEIGTNVYENIKSQNFVTGEDGKIDWKKTAQHQIARRIYNGTDSDSEQRGMSAYRDMSAEEAERIRQRGGRRYNVK